MKQKELVAQMSLEEKAAFLGGKNEWATWDFKRLGIPEMIFSDGPSGVRRQAGAGDHLGLNPSLPATCVPSAATLANSWDVSLTEEMGRLLGEEAMAEGVQVLLGPGMNTKRSPLCGRNFEYYSEDPYLAGKMAAGLIRGIQSQGVYACAKHFAVNSQEERRMAMNAVVDERAMRELYLTQFEIAVKQGGVKAVMTSYNEVNGTYANENEHLLKDILRKDWGFDGMVVTDWGGSNDHVAGVQAGSDLEMPNPGLDSARILLNAVEEGRLSETEIDARVDTLLDAVLETTGAVKKQKDIQGKQAVQGQKADFDIEAHHAAAGRAAAQCSVLLKNEDDILPLKKGVKVAVVGDFAFEPRYQGAGSSLVNVTKLDTIQEEIQKETRLQVIGMCRGYDRQGAANEALLKEAVELAGQAEVVLYFFGLNEMSEVEGLDRTHLQIPRNMVEVLTAMAAVNPNIVGVLSAGSPIEMDWDIHMKGLLHGYLTGQAGAGAILDLLTGRVNPSGKLAETYPVRLEDTPAYAYYPGKERNTEHRESIFIGYRYYDTAGVQVRYPFGYGLSYTAFAYENLKISREGVSFTIRNTGKRDGAEIAQLYISLPETEVFRPEKELKGFAKVFLSAGESKEVQIPFDEMTFRYWNTETNGWSVESGAYKIRIGASAADIRLTGTLVLEGTGEQSPYDRKQLPSYFKGQVAEVSDKEYEALLGRKLQGGGWGGKLTANDSICQLKYSKLGLARLVCRILESRRKKAEASGRPDLNILFICNMPFRAIAKMTGGMVSMEMVDGIVKAVNGHFFRGIGTVIQGYFRNRKENRAYEKRIIQEKQEGREQA